MRSSSVPKSFMSSDDAAEDEGGTIEVTLVCSPAPRVLREFRLRLAEGACVADALAACDLRREFPQLDPAALATAVWGRRAAPSQRLGSGDRIELCRPLATDPKLARRERFARQGRRTSGLFAAKKQRAARTESGG